MVENYHADVHLFFFLLNYDCLVKLKHNLHKYMTSYWGKKEGPWSSQDSDHYSPPRWQITDGMSMRESIHVSESCERGVCSALWKWEGKLKFSITNPPIPFLTGLGSLKAAASVVRLLHHHFVLAEGNYSNSPTGRATAAWRFKS